MPYIDQRHKQRMVSVYSVVSFIPMLQDGLVVEFPSLKALPLASGLIVANNVEQIRREKKA